MTILEKEPGFRVQCRQCNSVYLVYPEDVIAKVDILLEKVNSGAPDLLASWECPCADIRLVNGCINFLESGEILSKKHEYRNPNHQLRQTFQPSPVRSAFHSEVRPGFSACRVVIPRQDIPSMDSMVLCSSRFQGRIPIIVDGFDEWPNQGCCTTCTSSCTRTSTVPMRHHHALRFGLGVHRAGDSAGFLVEGKPLIMYGSFDWSWWNQVQGN